LDVYRCDTETISGEKLGLTPVLPKLDGVRILIMADVPVRVLSPSEQLRIRKFVENGGELIVFGGFLSFGHGGMKNSFIEEILPISIKRTFDRIKFPEGQAEVRENKFWFPKKYGNCAWIHDVALKPDAEVVMKAGDFPAVVKGKFGKGHVVAVLGTVLGEPSDPFWESKEWKEFMSQIIKIQ